MLSHLAPLALILAQASAPVAQAAAPVAPVAPAAAEEAPLPELTAQQAEALHCAVAFAKVNEMQKASIMEGLRYPRMDEGGQEYFVRVFAKLMDDLKADRETITRLAAREVAPFDDYDVLEKSMGPCLALLHRSGFG